jgi:hypothetical protein
MGIDPHGMEEFQDFLIQFQFSVFLDVRLNPA